MAFKMALEMARVSMLFEVYIESLVAVWTHGMAPALVATLNMMSLMVAQVFVIGLYPFHDTVACVLNGTGVWACTRLHPLFSHRTNVTSDMLTLHKTFKSVAGATVKKLKGVYKHGNSTTAAWVCELTAFVEKK